MVTTLLEIDPSVQDEVAVNITRSVECASILFVCLFVCSATIITKPFAADTIDYVNQVYFIQCSLSANTTDAVIDMQTNNLLSPTPISQPSTQWKINEIELSNNWQAQVRYMALISRGYESSITYCQF